jgi:hypothetical protein
MGTVIEPHVLVARRYVKHDATVTLDEALRAAEEGQQELEAWRRHRERQRRPLVPPVTTAGPDPRHPAR